MLKSKSYNRGFMEGYGAFAKSPLFGEPLRLAAKKGLRHVNQRDLCLADKLDYEHGFVAGAGDAANDDGWKTLEVTA